MDDHGGAAGRVEPGPWYDEQLDAGAIGSKDVSKAPALTTGDVVFPRLLFGWIVLICAEVFSGASLQMGLWHPWTLLMTYWLYFAHFFFFTTLAARTGRTSLPSLYLWGVLYGLYESWITKVIWSGYSGDGKFAMGRIGPFGFSELSMVFAYHPVASFLLPLAAACVLCPALLRLFPDVAWFTSQGRWARVVRWYLLVSFGLVMGVNSGTPVRLGQNVVVMLVVLYTLWRLARPGLAALDARPIVDFGRPGFTALCVYLLALYGLTYFGLRWEALPSAGVQIVTLGFYALAIAGLWRHRPRTPLAAEEAVFDARAARTVLTWFGLVFVLGFVVSALPKGVFVIVPFFLILAVWPVLGFILCGVALVAGTRGTTAPAAQE